MIEELGQFFRNGWPRMKKDARVVMWPFAISALVGPVIVTFAWSRGLQATYADWGWMCFVQFIAFNLMAASLFGHEFRSKTIEYLLSQPTTRFTLYNEKLLVCSAMIVGCLVLDALLHLAAFGHLEPPEVGLWPPGPAGLLLMAIAAVTTAPWLSLKGRTTIEGMYTAIFVPYGFLVGIFVIRLWLITRAGRWDHPKYFFGGFECAMPWACAAYWWGLREFQRLEV